MFRIRHYPGSFLVENDADEKVFIANDIAEGKRLLEYIVYSLGINTDTHVVDIAIRKR